MFRYRQTATDDAGSLRRWAALLIAAAAVAPAALGALGALPRPGLYARVCRWSRAVNARGFLRLASLRGAPLVALLTGVVWAAPVSSAGATTSSNCSAVSGTETCTF